MVDAKNTRYLTLSFRGRVDSGPSSQQERGRLSETPEVCTDVFRRPAPGDG